MNTVGENIIATAKIQNKYGAITILEKCPFLKGNKIISHFDGSNNIFVDCT